MSEIYGLYDTHPNVKNLQRALNETFDLELKVDGNIGKITQEAILRYHTYVGINEFNDYGACYGPLTQVALKPFIEKKYIQESDFANAAKELNVDIYSVKAFASVEAKEFGFLSNGFPVILFERHKFYNYIETNRNLALAKEYALRYSDICNPTSGGYLGGKAEMNKYLQAKKLNPEAAKSSCSWGMFQVMGFNYRVCGYENVDAFVEAMMASEGAHLSAFIKFIKADKKLHNALIAKDWSTVARIYNGPAYAKNQYDIKMANAYLKFKNE